MEKNQFGKVSRLILQAERRGEKTVLTDVQFTAPYKIMKPFPRPKGGICVMQLAASAGIMEGDRQEIRLLAGPGAPDRSSGLFRRQALSESPAGDSLWGLCLRKPDRGGSCG